MSAAPLLPALVLGPLAAAGIVTLLPVRLRAAATLVAAAGLVAVSAVVVVASASGRMPTVALAGWEAPLGIVLRADPAAAVLVTLTAVVGAAVTIAASADERLRGGPAFWSLWLALWGALNGVWVARDLFTIYVMLELVTVAAVSLVALGGRRAMAPALRYLFVAVTGSLLYLMAVALVYGETGTLDLALAAERAEPGPVLTTALVLVLVGMAAKMALFPLHSWLPVAHPAAPAAASALLSALVVKAAVFVLWRVWASLGGIDPAASPLALAAGTAGAVAVVWGSAMALRQLRLKHLIAYSTVAQLGYFAIVLSLVERAATPAEAAAAWSGGLTLVLSHGLAKAAMFLAAGAFALAYGSDRLADLRGAARHMPLTTAAIGVAGVSIAGLPPTLGFVAKWQLLTTSIAGGQWWWVLVFVGGGLLALGYTAKVLRATFAGPGDEHVDPPAARAGRTAALVPFSLAMLSVVFGILPFGIIAPLVSGGAP